MDLGSIVADVVTCEARQCGGAFAGPLTDETPSADKGLDSLGFASVMVALERVIGRDPFADEDEISYPKPLGDSWWHCIEMIDAAPIATAPVTSAPVTIERSYRVNMPHMALGGLSESWLFKEMGDAHWALITKGLDRPSSQLTDANGARLYATFTRIQFRSNVPLVQFQEDDHLVLTGGVSRFGASFFFSDLVLAAGGRRITARLMSTFAKRQNECSNVGLLNGIQPIHDVNGVNLLYFAAYPAISDLGEQRGHSDEAGSSRTLLSRASDGKQMAFVMTEHG